VIVSRQNQIYSTKENYQWKIPSQTVYCLCEAFPTILVWGFWIGKELIDLVGGGFYCVRRDILCTGLGESIKNWVLEFSPWLLFDKNIMIFISIAHFTVFWCMYVSFIWRSSCSILHHSHSAARGLRNLSPWVHGQGIIYEQTEGENWWGICAARKCYKCHKANKATVAEKKLDAQRKKSDRQLAAARLRIMTGNGTDSDHGKVNFHDKVPEQVVMPPPDLLDNETLPKIQALEKRLVTTTKCVKLRPLPFNHSRNRNLILRKSSFGIPASI